jgi:uncharacterized protein
VKRLQVAWYGGEPLLALDIIESLSERLVSICDSRSYAYDASIVTNGYGLTGDVGRALVSRRVSMAQVTLDGPAQEHDRRRFRLGGGGSFERIVSNMRRVVDESTLNISVRINIDSRNAESVYELIDNLGSRGFGGLKRFGVYFAPVEAITEGCHNVANDCLSKAAYGELEAALTRYAFDAGLCSLPYPHRYRGLCGALRPHGYVILPNGDIHKCWDTVASQVDRVGTIFDIDGILSDERALRWARWSPFDNTTCSECEILPTCAGSCAHKFVNAEQTRGEAGGLPCPSWKYNIRERLLLTAERTGAICAEDRLDESTSIVSATALRSKLGSVTGRRSLPLL